MRRDNLSLPDDYYTNSFIAGLSDYIQAHLQCNKPKDLQDAMWMARRLEQASTVKKPVFTPFSVRRQVNFDLTKTSTVPQLNLPSNQALIQQARQKGICFRCKEPWVPGHRQVCKLSQKNQIQALQAQTEEPPEIVYIIESDEDLAEFQALQGEEQLKISMHALMGIAATSNTFIVNLQIGSSASATAFIDSGSTSTFMSPALADKISVPTVATKRLKVQVANGGTLWTQFMCKSCSYSIQGNDFTSDFRIMQLKGYDIILGTDWLKKYSPVEMNFILMTMKITDTNGAQVLFHDEKTNCCTST